MQLIADILSFNNNKEALSKFIKNTSIDWDAVVIIGSKQLMLPALYCQLKDKALLHLIPSDLNIYLEEIAKINKGRNEMLLKEAHEISEIFYKEHIDHVFIKGMAQIAGHAFKDIAERMIGDMDILVAKKDLYKAFDLLAKNGYTDNIDQNFEQKHSRHLSRQVSQKKFGAIELHSEVLVHNYKHLMSNEQVLMNKRTIDGIAIPSIEDSIKIAIFALQINDRAHLYGYLGYKPIYDCLALNLPTEKTLLKNLSNEKHSQSFLNISSTFFTELTPYKTSNYSTLLKRYFIFRLNYPKLGNFIFLSIKGLNNIHIRIKLFITNKSYRNHILNNKILLKRIFNP